MITSILIILFIGVAIVSFSKIIAINKIVAKRLFVSQSMLTKSDWLQIGKHFLYIIAGVIAFLLLVLLLYYFGYWRTREFHVYY
jgi:heme/copper-type cytochrome/quinol oxidase subunit 3